MPRRFTTRELSTITMGEYEAMTEEDKLAYDKALLVLWTGGEDLQGDVEYVERDNNEYPRGPYEIGE